MKFIPYNTQEEAQSRIDAIDLKYGDMWEYRSTTTYAIPSERIDGKFYVPVLNGFEEEFSEVEISLGVEVMPGAVEVEI